MPNVNLHSNSNLIGNNTTFNPNVPKNVQNLSQQPTPVESLTENEENVLNSFERYKELYNNAYRDENKQKDFNNKIVALGNKLKNHEVKPNVLNILNEFIIGKKNFIKYSL